MPRGPRRNLRPVPARKSQLDATLGQIVRPHRLDARAASERQVRQLVRGIVGARGDDAVARTEVERGHRLAEGHGRVLDDGHVPGRRAHQTPQQLVRLAYAGLCFIGCFIPADRRFPLEEPDERLKHRLRHERGTRVVETDPVPASRRLAAPAVQLGSGGQSGGNHRHERSWDRTLCSSRRVLVPVPTPEAWARYGTALQAQCITGPTLQSGNDEGRGQHDLARRGSLSRTTHSPAARRAAACTTGTSASHS